VSERKSSGRAVAFIGPGLLLAVVAMAMFEQSARWLLTALTRDHFVRDELELDHLRDRPGEGGFGYGGYIVSSGERAASSTTIMVPLERLREIDVAGTVPGARVPVHYLPATQPWTALDYVLRFRVQAPEVFATDALDWTVVNLLIAVAAVWLIRKGVRVAKQQTS
jgi:hypothetical protein